MVAYQNMDSEMAKKYREAENLRKVAFVGVAVATVATLICVVSLPMVYNYVQYVHIILQNEADFCRVRNKNM